jgi:hypothetical protein
MNSNSLKGLAAATNMQRLVTFLFFVITVFTLPSMAKPGMADEFVDPAPSGDEQSVIYVGGDSIIVIPGSDSPVEVTQEGENTTFDFNQGEVGDADSTEDLDPENATVIYDDSGYYSPSDDPWVEDEEW